MKSAYEVRVAIAPEAAFAFLADVANEVQWRQSIVGSRYVGTRAPAVGVDGETDVAMGSRSLTMRWAIVAFEPGRHVAWRLDGEPWNGGGAYTVMADGEGCRIRADLEVRLKGAARVFEPLVGLQFRKGLRTDLDRLAVLLEGDHSSPS